MAGKIQIGVMGPGHPDPEAEALAERVGKLIAEADAVLICGGLGGAMKAAARGAKEAGGLVAGILPGTSPADANPYVDIAIATGMGNARNSINALSSGAVIAVRGAAGTLSEIALALKSGRPVVALQSWNLGAIGLDDPLFHTADTPEQAVALALRLANK